MTALGAAILGYLLNSASKPLMSNNIPEIVLNTRYQKKILDTEKKYIRDAIITRRNNINKAF